MKARRLVLRGILPLPLLAAIGIGRALSQAPPVDPSMVQRALSNELAHASNTQQPMRYQLRKSSPRYVSTKSICESKDGAVARLIAVNDKALGALDEQKEQARLNGLLSDPSKQRHRKQSEDDDLARVLKVLRSLPTAFTYQYAGAGTGRTGWVQKFTFKPNPNFEPPDLETQALTAMAGEIWIDPAELRVVRLEGHLTRDIDFGWGVLGRLNKGGWIIMDQSDVGNHQWRIVRFQMVMSGRVVFKTKSFDTLEEQTHYEPVPVGLGYAQAIQILRSGPDKADQASR